MDAEKRAQRRVSNLFRTLVKLGVERSEPQGAIATAKPVFEPVNGGDWLDDIRVSYGKGAEIRLRNHYNLLEFERPNGEALRASVDFVSDPIHAQR